MASRAASAPWPAGIVRYTVYDTACRIQVGKPGGSLLGPVDPLEPLMFLKTWQAKTTWDPTFAGS
jgi:hypothetical protein